MRNFQNFFETLKRSFIGTFSVCMTVPLMFGPNYILVTLRLDDGRFPSHENACRWFLNRYK